ncbi:Crp/Fnr family transcriptional regulator [Ancylomarina salipaludis]|uniref:Crp/Fnr family transcriptional regulator n=1 Tax=Ancylomarina salipaludis TaxID=2501299 RepID=A0A4Q1JME2_9BACT|nr:Crp/Fnr family transcriptional regulator [Ancylomarina salipaludis]RXQ95718.1 Crp/Fnr family transcriptional regulator [Ancylomarina salipaludis]
MINHELLLEYGGEVKTYESGERILNEGERAEYFYQVVTGQVKMNNFNEDGKEYIQGLFSAGKSFGEPPLFGNFKCPANAEAISKVEIIRLKRDDFFQLLKENPDVHLEVTTILAERLHYKAIMVSEISSNEPEHRILRLLDYLKEQFAPYKQAFSYEVKLTRQQIGDLTGLRVETVIRTIKTLEIKGEVEIRKRKVYR